MCSAHGKVRKSPLYTNINRQNVRALISVPSSVHKSKIVGYSRRAFCRQSHETNIFPRASREGNSLSKTRAAFDITLEYGDNPFLPNDCKYRRICGMVGQIELQRTCRSWQPFHRKHTRVFTHTRDRDRLVAARSRQRNRSPKNLRFLARTFLSVLSPFSITESRTPFGIQSVCVSFL